MKTFYLLRHDDVHGHSGLGLVAEGVIYHNGLVTLVWYSKWKTVTMFSNIKEVQDLHSHGGKTEIVVEGRRNKKDIQKFNDCINMAREKKLLLKSKKQ